MAETALDRAHAAMEAAPDDDALRLRFFDRFADAELFLMLEAEADGDQITPALFPVEGTDFALAFDTEERLSTFAGQIVPYAALTGRALAGLLSGNGLGLALNPDVAPSATLLDPAALAWLNETLSSAPTEATASPVEFLPPKGVPEALLAALDAKLPAAAGLADLAYLARVTYDDGRTGHLVTFIDAHPGAEPALARAVNEALTFSGIEAGALDVAFLRASDPAAAKLARTALRFDLPAPPEPETPRAPGLDPDRPPRLK